MMDEDFRYCKTPREAYNLLLTKLATGYVITEPEGNTFELLKGKFILTPAEKSEAKNPVKLFEILQRKGILKCPDCGPLKECFRDVDHRALPFIEEAESWIRDQNGSLNSDGYHFMRKNDVLKNYEEGDYEQILDDTIAGIECFDETSTVLKMTLEKIKKGKCFKIGDVLKNNEEGDYEQILNDTIAGIECVDETSTELKRILEKVKNGKCLKRGDRWSHRWSADFADLSKAVLEYKRQTDNIYDTCRRDLVMTIEKADQQPRLAGLLRRTLDEDSNLGLGNENSINVIEMLDDLESEGQIGPQMYSYLKKIMYKLDKRLGGKVERAKKKQQDLQKALLKALNEKIDEMLNGQVCECHGKRKRDGQDDNRNSKRHNVSSH